MSVQVGTLRPAYSDSAVVVFQRITEGMLLQVHRVSGAGRLVEGMSAVGMRRNTISVNSETVAEVTAVGTPLTRTQGRIYFWYSLPEDEQAESFILLTDEDV